MNVRYKITFPVAWPLPKVTSIILNNQIICTGPPDIGNAITAIKLEHNLYTEAAAFALKSRETGQVDGFIPKDIFKGSIRKAKKSEIR